MTRMKKTLIFLSAVFLIIIGNKKNNDFMNQSKKENSETENKKNETNTKSEIKVESDEKERATASK